MTALSRRTLLTGGAALAASTVLPPAAPLQGKFYAEITVNIRNAATLTGICSSGHTYSVGDILSMTGFDDLIVTEVHDDGLFYCDAHSEEA